MVARIIIVAVLAFALLQFAGDTGPVPAGDVPQELTWQNGVDRVDSFLQQGLTKDTHQKISDGLTSSADLVRGVSDKFLRRFE